MNTMYFAAYEQFGQRVSSFYPQNEEEWDDLHTSTKQNCSYVWADDVEKLYKEWFIKVAITLIPVHDNWYLEVYYDGEELLGLVPNDEDAKWYLKNLLKEKNLIS